jgi:Rieske Fe-S protein
MSLDRSRRAFLADCGKIISSTALAAIVLPILQGCEPTSIPAINEPITEPSDPDGRFGVDVSDLSEARPVKQAVGLKGSDTKGILVTRVAEGDYRALSMECTHQQCPVNNTATNNFIPCQCHGSQFHLDGTVKQGPAEDPLKRYDAIYDAAKKELRIMLS